jgi:hypothetical protein
LTAFSVHTLIARALCCTHWWQLMRQRSSAWLDLSSGGGQLGEAALSPLLLDALPRNKHLRFLDCQCFGLASHAFSSGRLLQAVGANKSLRHLRVNARCHAASEAMTFVDDRRKGLDRAAAEAADTAH